MVRVAVLGVGRIGMLHASLVASRVPGATLAMIYDTDEPAAAAASGGLRVPAARSLDSVLSDDDVDGVAICTSTDTHADLIVAAAEAGKAILCEKPISLVLTETDRAVAAVASAEVPFQVGFNRRFDPAHRSVREAIADGRVGELHLVRISSRDPAPPPMSYIGRSGGIFLDMTIHDFDMARFITGSEVIEVFAQGAVRIDAEIGRAGDYDTAVVNLRHADGCLTVIDNSRQAVYGYDQRVEAFGSKGMATSANPPAHSGSVWTADGVSEPALPTFFVERYTASYVAEWEAFVGYVTGGGPSPVSASDGRAPLVLGLAAGRSIALGRPVAVAEVDPC